MDAMISLVLQRRTQAPDTLSCRRVRPGGLHQELGIASGDALSYEGCSVSRGKRHFVDGKAKRQRNKHVVKAISSTFSHAWQWQ